MYVKLIQYFDQMSYYFSSAYIFYFLHIFSIYCVSNMQMQDFFAAPA